MAYVEWGEPDNPDVVICVHGLTRNGRDFDELATALTPRFRVVCPDVVGRGWSDWLDDPQGYDFPQYVSDMLTLIGHLGVRRVSWVGTSMGGLIGMAIAGLPESPVSRLVLNDIGPHIEVAALQRVGEFVAVGVPRFSSVDHAVAYMRKINASLGNLEDREWRRLTMNVIRQDDEGQWVMRYDPRLMEALRAMSERPAVDLWAEYERIRCPVLVTRGLDSDFLSAETAQQMTERGPKAGLVGFPGVGHTPMFLSEAQISPVRDFLLGVSG